MEKFGQRDAQSKAKHASKQQDKIGVLYIQSHLHTKQSERHVTPQEWNICLTRQKNLHTFIHKEVHKKADASSAHTEIDAYKHGKRYG